MSPSYTFVFECEMDPLLPPVILCGKTVYTATVLTNCVSNRVFTMSPLQLDTNEANKGK